MIFTALFLLGWSFSLHYGTSTSFVSILGDPGLLFKPYGPRIMLEGWNDCNRAGPDFANDPYLPSPRYADCIVNNNLNIFNNNTNNCTYGPYQDNCVSIALNNASNPSNSNITNDQFSVIKEQMLGSACQINQTFFWTSMLKSGNLITSYNICSTPYAPYNVDGINTVPLHQINYNYKQRKSVKTHMDSIHSGDIGNIGGNVHANGKSMNQPLVYHEYTNMNNDMKGYFNGTWDLDADINNIMDSNYSFFKLNWYYNNSGNYGVLSNYLQTSSGYPWLMLYTGVDVNKGEKGGVPYDGRGLMLTPTLVYHNITNNYYNATKNTFLVNFKLNLKMVNPVNSGASFYFINMGSCWKNNGKQCDGNTTTDVTQYVLMDSNPNSGDDCTPSNKFGCPRFHTFINGTVVSRNDTGYPFDAYRFWCMPWECKNRIGSEHTCDPVSNPMQQSILKLAPHPEWGPHGFPTQEGEGYLNDTNKDKLWSLNVGNLLNRIWFGCDMPNVTKWTTFNIGPEIFSAQNKYQWDISHFDILVPNN